MPGGGQRRHRRDGRGGGRVAVEPDRGQRGSHSYCRRASVFFFCIFFFFFFFCPGVDEEHRGGGARHGRRGDAREDAAARRRSSRRRKRALRERLQEVVEGARPGLCPVPRGVRVGRERRVGLFGRGDDDAGVFLREMERRRRREGGG